MDCAYIPQVGYSQFRDRLREKISSGLRYPFSGSLELTFRCNLRCKHCYVSHGHAGIPGMQELTTAETQRILDEVVDAGCLWFLLTGGEPLVRRDFMDIYTYAKRKGLLLTLFTNGTMITPRLADHLAEYRPLNIEITLYGYTQSTYERVTGIRGSHARCMRGIELLLERNLPLKLKTMIMTLNQDEFTQMRDFAKSLGVEFRYDPLLNAGLQGDGTPTTLRITPADVLKYDTIDPENIASWQEELERFRNFVPSNQYLYGCGAGLHSFHIDPYGELSVCMMARQQSYNLREGSFQEGWGEYLANVRAQAPQQQTKCQQCKLLPLCGQCPGWSYTEHGDSQTPVAYLCQVAHLRAEAFNFNTVTQ